MENINKIILLLVPMSICNLRCQYCYLTHRDKYFENKQFKSEFSPEHVRKALSKKRLGGVAYINVCAEGETLLADNIVEYIRQLLEEGHYIEVITNLTITSKLDEILQFDKELLKKIEFKCSFHYLELKERKLLETFTDNVHKIWSRGSSATIEIMSSDEYIPYIEEIKKFCLKNFGALPHVSIARNDASKDRGYLTKLSKEEYEKVWSSFESELWEFKNSIFNKRITDFCYAGEVSLFVDLETGITKQCYRSNFIQNIFEDIEQPIIFKPIGECLQTHCYNGHAFLTMGCVKNFTSINYADLRNRRAKHGNWLSQDLREFFTTKIIIK